MADDPKPSELEPDEAGPRPGQLTALLQDLARAPDADRGSEWAQALRPGAMFGRFELVREIGRGGFGLVWEAKDRELGCAVAFKAVRTSARPGATEERLLREAETAARLSHPNIVTLFDVGRTEHGPYLVLELLQGKTLEERLSQGPLATGEALRIATEIASGVAHAHAKGVMHRDLKPANVFVCDDGQVKVLDFGMAHAFGHRRQEGGTPGYMAPEQREGAPEDERADVFALGVILYRMLTGELPFRGDDAARFAHPPELTIPERPACGELVARMLANNPVHRPRDAGVVLTALRALLNGSGNASPSLPPSIGTAGPRVQRASPRTWAAVAVGALVVAALALVYQYVAHGSPRGGPAGPDGRIVVAVADVLNETGEKDLDVLSGLLVTSLEQSRKLAVMTQARMLDLAARAGRTSVTRVDETLGREVGKAHAVRALLLPAIRRLGSTYSLEMRAVDPVRDRHLFTMSDRATTRDALLSLLDRLAARARTELGEGASEVAGSTVQVGSAVTRSMEAYQHYLAGLEARSRDGLMAVALKEFLAAVEFDPEFAAAHDELACLYRFYQRPDLAAPHRRRSNEYLERMPEKEQLVLRLRRSVDASSEHYSRDEALRIAGAIETRFPGDKYALTDVAESYYLLGLRDRWEPLYRRILELDPAFHGAAVGFITWIGSNTNEALEVARRAVAMRRTPVNLTLLAEALHGNGRDAEAVAAARDALREDGGKNLQIVGVACDLLFSQRQDQGCLELWQQMSTAGSNEQERDAARFHLGTLLAFQGKVREALRMLDGGVGGSAADPRTLADVHQIGRDRAKSAGAVEHARRIAELQLRRNYLLWLGDDREADRDLASLEGKPQDFWDTPALELVRRGELGRAGELLRSLRADLDRRGNRIFLLRLAVLHAEVLLADGRPAEASQIWPGQEPRRTATPLDYAANYPRLALVRARAMERLGRSAEAVRELDGVLEFWKDGDPDLPLLVEARSMRKRLARAEGETARR